MPFFRFWMSGTTWRTRESGSGISGSQTALSIRGKSPAPHRADIPGSYPFLFATFERVLRSAVAE